MTNVDPPSEIPPRWESTFKNWYGNCVEESVGTFREEQEEQYRDDLENGIKDDKRHRQLVNLCIFPFVEFQLLGYEFIWGDPLEELGVKNFDFLLYDFEGNAIFGEAKGSVGDGWESNYVEGVIEERQMVNEHEHYIVENYTGQEIDNKEYVIATFAPDADKITREILSRGENIVTWKIHQMDKEIKINTPAPPKDSWPDNPDEYYQLTQHEHAKLNSRIEKIQSSSECIDLFPESHPVTEMRSIIQSRHKESGHCYLNREDLATNIRDSLFYLPEKEQAATVERVIQLAKEIGFIREYENGKEFKIVSRYTNSDGLEDTLKAKWIDHKVQDKVNDLKDECWNRVTEQILSKAKPQTQLDEFVDTG